MSIQGRLGVIFAALALAGSGLPLAAQSSTSVCGPALDSFMIEAPLDPSTIKTTVPPRIDAATMALIQTKEIRSRYEYNAATSILTNDIFFVDRGAPNPTPASVKIREIRSGFSVVNVDQVILSCLPQPSVMLTGTVADGATLFGPPTGAPYAFAFTYTARQGGGIGLRSVTIQTISAVTVGIDQLYHGGGAGQIQLSGSRKGDPAIKVTSPLAALGATPAKVSTSPVMVDASGTTDADGGILQFHWVSNRPAAFWPGNTAVAPRITFLNGPGDYKITLYVSSSSGGASTTNFTLSYSGAQN